MSTQSIYYAPGSDYVCFGAAAAAWNTSTAYAVGIMVTNGGSTYFCLLAHTSGTFATDLSAGKWLLLSQAIVWTPQAEGTGKGRLSAVWDRGAGHLPADYRFRCSTRWAATPAAGDALRLYLPASMAAATAALTDGGLTFGDAELTSEAALSSDCQPLWPYPIAAAVDQLWIVSGEARITARYVALAGWNSSATKALTNTASDHWCLFYSIPPSIEAAA